MTNARSANQRDRQKAETRSRLLDAATEVFLASPPTTASLAEIAIRAGVRRQTLLYHFGNREGLMNEVLLHHLEAFEADLRDHRGGLRSGLEKYLRAHRRPVVRMLRQLDMLVPETASKAGTWYPVVRADIERRLVKEGLDLEVARRRAPVLVLALLHLADRVARDLATEDEIADFVDVACEMALASTAEIPRQ